MKPKNSLANLLRMVTLCVLSSYFVACNTKTEILNEVEKYTTFKPLVADSAYTQEYVAEIQSIQHVELRARVQGYIDKLHVDEGQTVTKGQLLFSLNSNEFLQETLKAEAQLSAAKASLKQIEVEISRTQLLTDKNVISKTDLEMAMAKKEAILAEIQQAEAHYNLAKLNLSFTEIKAPFDGVISRIPNKLGALIEEGALLTTISNNAEMFAYFNVSENSYLQYITQNHKNNIVKLQLSNGTILPQTGVIETIDGEIDSNTGNLSFRARFANTQKWLKHGSSGKVLISNTLSNAILIPQQSTFEVQENLYVYVVDEKNTVHQRKIVPQLKLGSLYVVQSGLSASDNVLYEGIQLVKEGDVIVPELQSFNQINHTQKPQ
jgi:RND family efflux transporter MFP subunit